MLANVYSEVSSLHEFFQQWFNGSLSRSNENFKILENALDENFLMISTDGIRKNRSMTLEELQRLWGTVPNLKIEVDNIEIINEDSFSILAVYTEYQKSGENGNVRISSVLFRKCGNRLVWNFVQETKI